MLLAICWCKIIHNNKQYQINKIIFLNSTRYNLIFLWTFKKKYKYSFTLIGINNYFKFSFKQINLFSNAYQHNIETYNLEPQTFIRQLSTHRRYDLVTVRQFEPSVILYHHQLTWEKVSSSLCRSTWCGQRFMLWTCTSSTLGMYCMQIVGGAPEHAVLYWLRNDQWTQASRSNCVKVDNCNNIGCAQTVDTTYFLFDYKTTTDVLCWHKHIGRCCVVDDNGGCDSTFLKNSLRTRNNCGQCIGWNIQAFGGVALTYLDEHANCTASIPVA